MQASGVVRFAQVRGNDGFKTLQDRFQKPLSTTTPGFEALESGAHSHRFSRALAAPMCRAQALTLAPPTRLQKTSSNPRIATVAEQ